MDNTTKLTNLVDPEVMAPMISAKLPKAIVATTFAKIDTTLEGQAGSTITVPKYEYIGDAEEVAEGVAQGDAQLTTTTAEYKVKKIVKDVTITDEAVLSGYGNPIGEINNQLAKSIASKVDNDVIDTLKGAQVKKTFANDISYNNVIDTLDLFLEEENVPKVMFVHPHQISTLRKDANFISADKYNQEVIMRGEIGMIANTRVVASRKAVNEAGTYYQNPIVQLRAESQTGDEELSAVTIYLKRGVNVETDRIVKGKKTLISADEHYVVGLTDESKVVVAQFPIEGNPSL
ncbi:MAG: N4-gp56 family major capsid protein [Elusimicrobia bacterium]|nr:N4-gp56 family major capsid protein [Elusimicrobiota bacterium]